MPYRLQHITPKCTTDACRAVRHITHVEFATQEQAQAFVVAHGLNNVRVVEYTEVSEPQSAAPSNDA
jgi:hypothetical protein